MDITTPNIQKFLNAGPIAIVYVEDDFALTATFEHLRKRGFPNIIAVGDVETITANSSNHVTLCLSNVSQTTLTAQQCINILIPSLADRWVYRCYNAEFLIFPYCEGRTISDLTSFADEEQRNSIFSTSIDVYSDSKNTSPLEYLPQKTYLDAGGYFSMAHQENGVSLDRQIDVYGGLRWRFSEHFSNEERNINQSSVFKVHSELELHTASRFNDAEYNTISCPWHNNVTICTVSYRAYKKLRQERPDITDFNWFHTQELDWSSKQLMELGFMEPGQWF
jgi:hypothetical protein